MATIRAKMVVTQVTKFQHGACEVKLQPVTSGSEENKSFWKYTPSGEVRFHICNPEAMVFEAGEEYYLDFQKA